MRNKRINKTSAYSRIQLSDKAEVPKDLQYLRVGKFNHPQYGFFEITSQVLSEMIQNFKNNVRGIDIAFDYFHESDKDASRTCGEIFFTGLYVPMARP